MYRVYRGWIFTNDSTEEAAEAKKGKEIIKGDYHDIVVEIDRREYRRLHDDDEVDNV